MSTKSRKVSTLASRQEKHDVLAKTVKVTQVTKAKFTAADAADLGAKLDHKNADLVGQVPARIIHPHNPST